MYVQLCSNDFRWTNFYCFESLFGVFYLPPGRWKNEFSKNENNILDGVLLCKCVPNHMIMDAGCYDLKKNIFIILVIFSLFSLNPRIPPLWQVEKITFSNLTPCMCSRYYNHWIWSWVVMAEDRHISIILVISDLLIGLAEGK